MKIRKEIREGREYFVVTGDKKTWELTPEQFGYLVALSAKHIFNELGADLSPEDWNDLALARFSDVDRKMFDEIFEDSGITDEVIKETKAFMRNQYALITLKRFQEAGLKIIDAELQ